MFRVRWIQSALNELATIWTDADSSSRQLITAASHAIDQELQTEPNEKGESRGEPERIFISSPLGILYTVDESTSTVWVTHVWIILRRKK
jgi:hypothetical protein